VELIRLEQHPATRSGGSSVYAALAAVREEAASSALRFPGEDGGRSLADMAQRDLDAALQLLADRAQYITGASGAAIALRRDGRNDMLCRASSGTSAPELGALLSTEVGLSGESVRTRRLLRCDDAESDARVNRDVCRELGIASVVVTPVVHDDEVLGVFELFSGTANAFGERDLSAVQRLAEMVETAVRLAQTTERLPEALRLGVEEAAVTHPVANEPVTTNEGKTPAEESRFDSAGAVTPAADAAGVEPRPVTEPSSEPGDVAGSAPENAPAAKRLFWSAAEIPAGANSSEADQTHVPPVLRGLKKCEACGFPVSPGRALCVECEEKKWRGQLKPSAPPLTEPPGEVAPAMPAISEEQTAVPAPEAPAAEGPAIPVQSAESPASPAPAIASPEIAEIATSESEAAETAASAPAQAAAVENVESAGDHPEEQAAPQTQAAEDHAPDLVLSAAAEEKRSWIAANKYVIGVLLLMAGVIAAVFFLR